MADLGRIERDDPNFGRDLWQSRPSLWKAAQWLGDKGYEVTVPPLRERPSIDQRSEYSDSGDLFISGLGRHARARVEVKQRQTVTFTGRDDWQYPTMFVDAAHLWDNAEPKPVAYIIWNPQLTACAVIKTESANEWIKVERFDRPKKRFRTFYECPMKHVAFHSF